MGSHARRMDPTHNRVQAGSIPAPTTMVADQTARRRVAVHADSVGTRRSHASCLFSCGSISVVESHLVKVEVAGSIPVCRAHGDHVSSRLSPGRYCSTQSRDRLMAWIASMAAGGSRPSAAECRHGGIGIRAALRMLCPPRLGGSSPSAGTCPYSSVGSSSVLLSRGS